MRLLLALMGVLLMAIGFEAIEMTPWFGWLDVSLGVLALLSAPRATPSTRYLAPLGPIGVGTGAILLTMGGVVARVSTALLWATLGTGLAMLLIAAAAVFARQRL